MNSPYKPRSGNTAKLRNVITDVRNPATTARNGDERCTDINKNENALMASNGYSVFQVGANNSNDGTKGHQTATRVAISDATPSCFATKKYNTIWNMDIGWGGLGGGVWGGSPHKFHKNHH